MIYLYAFTIIILLISFISDKNKTIKGLKVGFKKFKKILPSFLKMLILVSFMLYLLPDKVIANYLGKTNIIKGTLLGSLIGSITMMPGFIAFPLSGILLNKGVSFMVISSFTTTLMMVGILTFPVEKEYFGTKLALIRNTLSYLIAIIIALAVGLFYGEIVI
ncbi:MAG: hypothetical protein FH753_12285 [Firmicutes bacterium]|nr:hypothetical protein [Bacillota bacterium]